MSGTINRHIVSGNSSSGIPGNKLIPYISPTSSVVDKIVDTSLAQFSMIYYDGIIEYTIDTTLYFAGTADDRCYTYIIPGIHTWASIFNALITGGSITASESIHHSNLVTLVTNSSRINDTIQLVTYDTGGTQGTWSTNEIGQYTFTANTTYSILIAYGNHSVGGILRYGISTSAITTNTTSKYMSNTSDVGSYSTSYRLQDKQIRGSDITAATFTSVSPSTNTSVNTTDVGYTLSEAIASGSVAWTRTGGTADSNSPHTAALTGTELNIGTRASAVLTNAPSLVSGAIYTIAFNGTDAAGNISTQVSVTGITFIDLNALACFPKGTPINTDDGIIEIQDIIPSRHTIRGNNVRAIVMSQWTQGNMILFKKNCLYKNVPSSNTLISMKHQIYYDGKMLDADCFVLLNKAEAIPHTINKPIYNVLLDKHDKMITNNMIVETQNPNSMIGYLYNNFLLNDQISKQSINTAVNFTNEFAKMNWDTYFVEQLKKHNGEGMLYTLKAAFIEYQVKQLGKSRKKVKRIMNKLLPT